MQFYESDSLEIHKVWATWQKKDWLILFTSQNATTNVTSSFISFPLSLWSRKSTQPEQPYLIAWQTIVKAQECVADEFVIKNNGQTVLRIDENNDLHACGSNVCDQLENGVQQLSVVGSSLAISGGNSVNLDDVSSTQSATLVSLNGTAQCIDRLAFTKTAFNRVVYDYQSEWDDASKTFIAKRAGLYQIISQCYFTETFDAEASFQMYIYKNGSPINIPYVRNLDTAGHLMTNAVSMAVLDQGDAISVICRHTAPAIQCLHPEYDLNFLAVHKMR